ncbi:acyltransferase family protein [Spirosoma aerophilum]
MNKRLQELDGLRGFAALGVAAHHYTESGYQSTLWSLGSTGVDLFFIISGYVILLSISNTKTWRDFVVSRFSRLFPTYWVALSLTIGLYLYFDPAQLTPGNIAWHVTMIPSLAFVHSFDPSYWTLGVELTFYILMGLCLVTNQLRRIEAWGVAMLVALLMLHLILPTLMPALYKSLTGRIEFLNQGALFFVGILFYNMHYSRITARRVFLLAVCVGLQCMLHQNGHTFRSISAVQHAGMIIGFVGLFFLFVAGRMNWIVNKLTLFLGSISYSFYLLHHYMGKHILLPWMDTFGVPYGLARLMAILFCLMIATVFSVYIENPSNAYIRNWYKGHKPVVAT